MGGLSVESGHLSLQNERMHSEMKGRGALQEASHWLAQVKLAEDNNDIAIALNFFQYSLQCDAQPRASIMEALLSFYERHPCVRDSIDITAYSFPHADIVQSPEEALPEPAYIVSSPDPELDKEQASNLHTPVTILPSPSSPLLAPHVTSSAPSGRPIPRTRVVPSRYMDFLLKSSQKSEPQKSETKHKEGSPMRVPSRASQAFTPTQIPNRTPLSSSPAIRVPISPASRVPVFQQSQFTAKTPLANRRSKREKENSPDQGSRRASDRFSGRSQSVVKANGGSTWAPKSTLGTGRFSLAPGNLRHRDQSPDISRSHINDLQGLGPAERAHLQRTLLQTEKSGSVSQQAKSDLTMVIVQDKPEWNSSVRMAPSFAQLIGGRKCMACDAKAAAATSRAWEGCVGGVVQTDGQPGKSSRSASIPRLARGTTVKEHTCSGSVSQPLRAESIIGNPSIVQDDSMAIVPVPPLVEDVSAGSFPVETATVSGLSPLQELECIDVSPAMSNRQPGEVETISVQDSTRAEVERKELRQKENVHQGVVEDQEKTGASNMTEGQSFESAGPALPESVLESPMEEKDSVDSGVKSGKRAEVPEWNLRVNPLWDEQGGMEVIRVMDQEEWNPSEFTVVNERVEVEEGGEGLTVTAVNDVSAHVSTVAIPTSRIGSEVVKEEGVPVKTESNAVATEETRSSEGGQNARASALRVVPESLLSTPPMRVPVSGMRNPVVHGTREAKILQEETENFVPSPSETGSTVVLRARRSTVEERTTLCAKEVVASPVRRSKRHLVFQTPQERQLSYRTLLKEVGYVYTPNKALPAEAVESNAELNGLLLQQTGKITEDMPLNSTFHTGQEHVRLEGIPSTPEAQGEAPSRERGYGHRSVSKIPFPKREPSA